jgi:hypothetical protein
MAQASNTITHSPADASRRRFLAVAGAASAVSVGALAAAAMPLPAPQSDAEVVTAGIKFEALLIQWMPAWFEWARLHVEALDKAVAKFGEDDLDNPAWHEPLTATAPAFLFQLEVGERNGCDKAAALESALCEQRPLSDQIRESKVTSVAGLRAKTLVSILDFWPSIADRDNDFPFGQNSHYELFDAAVAVTGLSGFVADVEKRLVASAGQTLRDGAVLVV